MLTRRTLLAKTAQLGALAAIPACLRRELGASRGVAEEAGVEVNDVQSQLNATRVRRIVAPRTVDEVAETLRTARKDRCAVSVCGGRHAMGGQQFGSDAILLDLRQLRRRVRFDRAEVRAGRSARSRPASIE